MSGAAVRRNTTQKIVLNDDDDQAPLVPRKHPYVESFYDALGKGPDRHKPRSVYMNNTERNFHNPLRFASNYISTTKYTPLTFIPKNLLEQFMKAANFYFLCVAIVVYIPGVTTIEPYTSVLPLVFVLCVTGIKEGYEDYQRYRSDIEINSRKVTIVTSAGEHKEVTWQDVVVGDIVRVENHAEFPVDLIVLSSSDVNGVCTIQTANLDGETNLKTRQALKDTCGLVTPQQLAQCRGRAVCEPPSNDLVAFEGVWKNGNVSIPLGSDQLLLRGARLEATEFVYGLCIYTGVETKISLNSNNPRHKRTKMDHVLNQQMYIIFFIQFCMVFLSGTLSAVYQRDFADKAWYFYLGGEGDTSSVASVGLINFFAYFILYSIMVPISLYVSMELVKVPQALLINFDAKMYDEETDTRALARTSSLNEELGQVEYVFSDKTGTLTQNKMSFYKCSIGGKRYGTEYVEEDEDPDAEPTSPQEEIPMSLAKNQYEIERNEEIRKARFKALSKFRDPALLQDLTQGFDYPSGIQKGFVDKNIAAAKKQAHFIQEFILNMAVCHTVIPVGDEKDEANGTITYRGASIDEVALVIGANELGFSVVGRDRNILTVNLPWKKHNVYEILDILEFNSDRKRMSVVVKMPNGKFRLYTKGADSVIFPRLHPNNDEEIIRTTKNDLEAFSAEGLRTLILAYADLEDQEYHDWARRYQAASQAIGGRREKMDAVANEIEGNLWLVGVSAIEDALQVGVPDTLHKLRHAGMKVWMLTGDKQGTAVNIGKSCGLIDQTYEIRYLNGTNKQDVDKELTALQAVMDRSAEVAAAKDAAKEKEVEVRIEHITRQLTHGKDRLPQFPPVVPPRGASAAGNSVSMSHDLDEKKGPAQPAPVQSFEHQQDMTGENGKATALIVDGPTLAHALHETNRAKLLGCINHKMCRVVVCSRMAPKQKASVVELIKANLPCVTLAIGDGANDVSMIQAAHVGIGIRGKEGLQAVNNSDYAIAQFRFLARLLLVHGRLSYKRNAKLILYQFYKGIAISFTQLWFAIHSAFGAFQVFDGLLMNTFNLFFASLPILAVAVLDRELNPDELMAHPELYRPGIRGSGFNMRVFWTWIGSGILHSIFVFFLPFYSLPQLGFWTQSVAAYSCLVIAANAKISINTRTWTAWNAGLVTLSIGLWCLFGFGLSSKAAIDYLPHFYQILNQAASTGSFWLCLLLMAWLAVMQEYITGFLNRSAKRPELKLIIQEQRQYKTKKGHLHDPHQPDSATAQYGKAANSPHKRPSATGGIDNDKL